MTQIWGTPNWSQISINTTAKDVVSPHRFRNVMFMVISLHKAGEVLCKIPGLLLVVFASSSR